MQKIVDYFKQYIGVISIVLAICILLTYSLSYFMVNTGNKRAAEMYVGELKYSITIDGTATNVVTAPKGESVIDLTITGIDEINTYYKLLYTYSGSGITVTYFDKTQNTSGNLTTYDLPGDSLAVKGTKKLKLKINNTSTSTQTVTFKVSGGYSTNTLADVVVPSGYNQITLTSQNSNTYFCTVSGTLASGLEYTNSGLTYKYKYQNTSGYDSSAGKSIDAWTAMYVDGWGVRLTDKTSTSAFDGKLCTYINNKPIKSLSYSFWNSKAETINLLYFDTHNVITMSNMFGDSSATSLYNLTALKTSNVTDMFRMFGKSSVTALDLSNFDTSKVTNMSNLFSSCKAATLDVSNFNTSKVTNMMSMFTSASSIVGLDKFDTSNVTNMNQMFQNVKVATLDLSNFDTSKVTNMGSMFSGTTSTSIDLSSFDTSNVTNMSNMFYSSQVDKLNLNNFDTSNVTSMYRMFANSNVTSLDLSSFDTGNVTNMSEMFYNTKLSTLDLSNFDTGNVTNMSEMFYNAKLSTLDLSNFDTSNVTNMNSMFRSSNATVIKGLENFNTINVTDMRYMFLNSRVLTLDLSNFELNSSVVLTNIFSRTSATVGYAKTQIIADKFNDSTVTGIPSTLFFIVKGGKTNAGVYIKNMKPTGLESTARDGLYRFVGTSNNYANMGGVTYRIIGITDNSTINTNLGLKQNQLKLIKATPVGTKAWEADRTTDNPWGSDDNDMYYYLNNTLINNTSYIPTAWKNRISSVNWYVGDAASASVASSLASLERGNTTSSTSKVGLMYFSDFYYSDAAGGTNCYSTACTSSWLYSSSYEQWSMTRRGHINNFGYYTWTVGTDGKAFTERVAATTIYYSPVFYLDQGVAITSGTGTSSSPFILDVNKDTYTVELQLNGETVGTYEVKKGSDLTTKIPTTNSIRMKSCDNASISTVENGTTSTIYVTSITGDTVCQMYYSLV